MPDQNEPIRCNLRGKFKLDFNLKKEKLYKTDIVTIGDYVEIDMNQDNTGTITKIFERENYISRKAPRIKGAGYRGERLEQVIAANVDLILILLSIKNPEFNNKTLDRFLASCESSNIKPLIVLNKIDLDEYDEHKEWIDLYSGIGYDIIPTSVKSNLNLDKIKSLLKNKKTIFWGTSGVGKSSMLNKIFPELKLQVGEISSFSNKGTHTTVTSFLIKVDKNTYIIDTPGIREIDPYGIRKEDLGHYFIDFKDYINSCKFNTCTHQHEPGCAVIDAVENEEISVLRYDSYLRLLETIEEDIIF